MPNSKKKKSNYRILILVIVLIIIIICAIILNKKNNKTTSTTKNETQVESIADAEDQAIIAKLQKLEERDRMEYYFGIFLDYIESGKYEKAYELLYSEFKENYFPTLEEFTEYVKATFPDMADISHENIERNGDVYVLWITITDSINGKPGEATQMNIVIRENDYNDFELSFSVI